MNTVDVDAAEVRPGPLVQGKPAVRPRWIAFSVILGVILVLLITPAVTSAVVPPPAEGVVGFYERFTLHSEPDDAGVLGGFIAPQGWVAIAPDEATNGKPERSFQTQDGAVTVTASVHAPVESPERLLRDHAPVGATLTAIHRLDSAPLLTTDLLEYDLEAGGGVSQRVAVCETLRNYSCLLFEVEVSANRVGADATPLLPDVAAMVASAEVLPSPGGQS